MSVPIQSSRISRTSCQWLGAVTLWLLRSWTRDTPSEGRLSLVGATELSSMIVTLYFGGALEKNFEPYVF